MNPYLDKVGGFGAIVAGAACPACFPQLAALGAIFGLGALGSYEGQIFLLTQALVVLAVVGNVLAFLQHRRLWLLLTALAGGVAFFLGLYVLKSEGFIYLGMACLAFVGLFDLVTRIRATRKLRGAT